MINSGAGEDRQPKAGTREQVVLQGGEQSCGSVLQVGMLTGEEFQMRNQLDIRN